MMLKPQKFVDDLIREFKSPTSVFSEALIKLELAGQLERHPGNKISAIVWL
jgi:DNA processing protein